MPTYNGAKYIQEQLNSILSQLAKNDEVIISDDSSTDETIKIIENFRDDRIRILSRNHFHSPVFNLENALKYANGDFIFLSDQDDIWMPNKVEVMIKVLEKVDLCVCDCQLIDMNGKMLYPSFFQLNHSKNGFWSNLIKNSYLGCCISFRRCVLEYALPFPPSIAMHDIWLGLCVELWGKSIFVNQKLIKYRRHDNNVSSSGSKSNLSVWYRIGYRFSFIFQLMKRSFYKSIYHNRLL